MDRAREAFPVSILGCLLLRVLGHLEPCSPSPVWLCSLGYDIYANAGGKFRNERWITLFVGYFPEELGPG